MGEELTKKAVGPPWEEKSLDLDSTVGLRQVTGVTDPSTPMPSARFQEGMAFWLTTLRGPLVVQASLSGTSQIFSVMSLAGALVTALGQSLFLPHPGSQPEWKHSCFCQVAPATALG